MDDNRVTVREHGRHQVIALAGEIDHALAADLERDMTTVAQTAAAVIVDLTAVTFLDSAGLRLLDRLVRRCLERQSAIRIVAPGPGAVRFTIDLSGFRPELITDTAEQAIADLSG
jgi:anti-sigma B factor antagonist